MIANSMYIYAKVVEHKKEKKMGMKKSNEVVQINFFLYLQNLQLLTNLLSFLLCVLSR